jgi:hypothetical protein
VLATLLLPGLSTDTNKTVTKQMPPAPVRIVDAPDTKVVNAPRTVDGVTASKDCAEQTWPYIEARCLTRATTAAAPLVDSERSAPTASVKPPVTPQTEITPGAARPNDPQPPLKDAPNNSVGPTTVGTAHVADTSSLPAPPGALVSTLPGEMPASAPQATDAARMAPVAVAAGLAMTRLTAGEQPKVRTRSDRRRRTAHSSRSFRLFGFRVGGLRF